jgi:hypothetical protein
MRLTKVSKADQNSPNGTRLEQSSVFRMKKKSNSPKGKPTKISYMDAKLDSTHTREVNTGTNSDLLAVSHQTAAMKAMTMKNSLVRNGSDELFRPTGTQETEVNYQDK